MDPSGWRAFSCGVGKVSRRRLRLLNATCIVLCALLSHGQSSSFNTIPDCVHSMSRPDGAEHGSSPQEMEVPISFGNAATQSNGSSSKAVDDILYSEVRRVHPVRIDPHAHCAG